MPIQQVLLIDDNLFDTDLRDAENVGDIIGMWHGLPIIKRSIEAHGGPITVAARKFSIHSAAGVGTTVECRLPHNG